MYFSLVALTAVLGASPFAHAKRKLGDTRGDITGVNYCPFDISFRHTVNQDTSTWSNPTPVKPNDWFWVMGPVNERNGTRDVALYASADGKGDYLTAHLSLAYVPWQGVDSDFLYSLKTNKGNPFGKQGKEVGWAPRLTNCPWAQCAPGKDKACVDGKSKDPNDGALRCKLTNEHYGSGSGGRMHINLCATGRASYPGDVPAAFSKA